MTVLSVRNLRVTIGQGGSEVSPVDDVSFDVGRGEIVGIAGESGSGKSLTLRSIIGLLPNGANNTGEALLDLDRTGLAPYDPAAVRGRGISFVFQEPMTALNPTMRVGELISLGLRHHDGSTKRAARRAAVQLMTDVGIPDPQRRADMWPHQLSGGLRQRVMIAVALSTNPRLLLCDEPTTALDVSVQDQILALLHRIREQREVSIVFVSHDLAVLGELCDRLAIMYAGRIMETGSVSTLLSASRHPYTHVLMRSMPSIDQADGRLATIPGQPPDPTAFPAGCRFAPRCPHADTTCAVADHTLVALDEPVRDSTRHESACIHVERMADATRATT